MEQDQLEHRQLSGNSSSTTSKKVGRVRILAVTEQVDPSKDHVVVEFSLSLARHSFREDFKKSFKRPTMTQHNYT